MIIFTTTADDACLAEVQFAESRHFVAHDVNVGSIDGSFDGQVIHKFQVIISNGGVEGRNLFISCQCYRFGRCFFVGQLQEVFPPCRIGTIGIVGRFVGNNDYLFFSES